MKDLRYYMSLPYEMEIIRDGDSDSYVVKFPDLPGCLTSGKSREEAIRNAYDAKENWIMAALEDGYYIKEPEVFKVG